MESKIVSITPSIAASMLELNLKNNRPISRTAVRQYTADMLSNKWKSTGDSIKFDNNGNLIDGQHRLTAIVESGLTQDIMVVNGLDADIVHFIDRGRKRTASDAMHIKGFGTKYTAVTAALIRKIINHQRGMRSVLQANKNNLLKSIPDYEILAFAEKNDVSQHSEFASRLYANCAAKLFAPADLAFIHWRFSAIDMDLATEFLTKLMTLDNVPATSPIKTLFDKLLSSKGLSPTDKLNCTYRAWNAYRKNETLGLLRPSSLQDVQPV